MGPGQWMARAAGEAPRLLRPRGVGAGGGGTIAYAGEVPDTGAS